MKTEKNTTQAQPVAEATSTRPVIAPLVDIYENEQEYLVLADLPGVANDGVEIRFEKGELSQAAAFKEYDRARERQNESRKRWRWANAIVPSLLVVVAGAVVWILRAALRAAPPRIPDPVPPADLVRGE